MSTRTIPARSGNSRVTQQVNGAPRLNHSLFDLLRADGFGFFGAREPEALLVGRSRYPTFVKNGVAIALQQSRCLSLERGDAIVYDADPTDVVVWALKTQPKFRRTGRARQAMASLIRKADITGVTLFLEPVPLEEGAMSREQLSGFYQSFGFTSNDSRNQVMQRDPQDIDRPVQPTRD